VLDARQSSRFGPLPIAGITGVPARTGSRILPRHGVPHLADCDPLTGALIRAARITTNRHERSRPGELVHLDVKKLGRIPDGGGWRAHGRSERVKARGIGYDYVHVAIDDHTRVGYAEVLPDQKGATAAGFLTRAGHFAGRGIHRIERIITDDALAYRNSAAFRRPVRTSEQFKASSSPTALDERQSRTLPPDPVNRMGLPADLHQQRPPSGSTCALAPSLRH